MLKLTHAQVATFKKVHEDVKSIFVWRSDQNNWAVPEHWTRPTVDVDFFGRPILLGDCVEENQKIWLKRNDEYVAVPIKDAQIGDVCMSYDFVEKKYIDKVIINKMDKGNLETFTVPFHNGNEIVVTENHNMWSKEKQQQNGYTKRKLKEIIDGKSVHWEYVPCALNLPYTEIENVLDDDIWFVVGHYLAEGWVDRPQGSNKISKVSTSGHDIPEFILPILDKYKIPYTLFKNNSGVPCVRFLKSWFKDFLKPLKENSFDIRMDKYLNLPEVCLNYILEGYFLGDGHYHVKSSNGGWGTEPDKTYSTSCKKFAEWIQAALLRVGKSARIYTQEKHGGSGTQPIYRVIYNKNSSHQKDYGFEGLGQTRIKTKDITSNGVKKCYDITVAGTSTFVFENGILGHNCEDMALEVYYRLRQDYNFPKDALRLTVCSINDDHSHDYDHCVLTLEYIDEHGLVNRLVSDCNHEYVKNIVNLISKYGYKNFSMAPVGRPITDRWEKI